MAKLNWVRTSWCVCVLLKEFSICGWLWRRMGDLKRHVVGVPFTGAPHEILVDVRSVEPKKALVRSKWQLRNLKKVLSLTQHITRPCERLINPDDSILYVDCRWNTNAVFCLFVCLFFYVFILFIRSEMLTNHMDNRFVCSGMQGCSYTTVPNILGLLLGGIRL